MMNLYLAFGAGAFVCVIGTWILEILPSRGRSQMPFSVDELVALRKVDQLMREFASKGLPECGRREVWRWISWIWKATRATAVRSGRLPAAWWLLGFALLCLGCAAKTLVVPESHDLRFLLAGNDFITFFAAGCLPESSPAARPPKPWRRREAHSRRGRDAGT